MNFKLPPQLTNEKGEIRKVGFEIEFADVSLEKAAALVMDLFGGKLEKDSKYNMKVVESEIGEFSLQIDLRLLSQKSYQKIFDKLGINIHNTHVGEKSLEELIETLLESAISTVIPNEISMPALPLTEMDKAENLKEALRLAGAKGTKDSMLYAFAMHLNPELPTKNVETLLAYTRSFLLLYPWLFRASGVDFTRSKLTTFISPFPESYFHLVLDPGYNPDLDTFIDDYHHHNPDRNRPLDLYPVFAFLDKEKIDAIPDIGKVSARPTFHYRLPNSLVDDPTWSLAQEWNLWNEVEKLASQPGKVIELGKEYLRIEAKELDGFENVWINKIEELVQ